MHMSICLVNLTAKESGLAYMTGFPNFTVNHCFSYSPHQYCLVCCSDALSSDIFLGDGHTVISQANHSACQQCVGLRPRPPTMPPPLTTLPPTAAPVTNDPLPTTTQVG